MQLRYVLYLVLLWSLIGSLAYAGESPLEVILRCNGPYLSADDPLALPMKVKQLSGGPRDMWGGGKDLFFIWTKTTCAGWLADKDSYVVQQGDQHLANLGTYLCKSPKGSTKGSFGHTAFGLIDFDESHRLPFQIELLQVAVGLRLAARQADITLDETQVKQLIDEMLGNYQGGVTNGQKATKMLENDEVVRKLLTRSAKIEYATQLTKYTDGKGRFKSLVQDEEGSPTEKLIPAMDRADDLAKGISQAIAKQDQGYKLFRITHPRDIRKHIKDVALRIHLRGSGSQGVHKYFILLEKPLVHSEDDIIFYAKQQIPTAPERTGLIDVDPRPAAERCAEYVSAMLRPDKYLSTWFKMGEESYYLTIHDPWGRELTPDRFKNVEDLMKLARLWGVAAGCTHCNSTDINKIRVRLVDGLDADLLKLSGQYLQKLEVDALTFKLDPKTIQMKVQAENGLRAMGK